MASGVYTGTLTTYSIGGSSYLEFLQNASIEIAEAQDEGAPVHRFGGNTQGLKRSAVIRASLFSDVSTAIRVSHLDLSAATLGSVNLLSPNITSMIQVQGNYVHKLNPGAGEKWAFPIVVDGGLTGSVELGMDVTAMPQSLIDLFSATYADLNKILDFTVNGVQVQIPFRMSGASIPIAKDGIQMFTAQLSDRTARAGVTVLPSGSTSILEKAINAPKTALAFAFQSAPGVNNTSEAIAISGNMIISSFTLGIRDGQLVPIEYVYASQGTLTGAGVAT